MRVSREGGDRRLHNFTIGRWYGQSGVAPAVAVDQGDPVTLGRSRRMASLVAWAMTSAVSPRTPVVQPPVHGPGAGFVLVLLVGGRLHTGRGSRHW